MSETDNKSLSLVFAMYYHPCFQVCLFCFFALLTGCSKCNVSVCEVTGTIRWNDQPVAGALVSFIPAAGNGRLAVGTTDEQGNYQLTTSAAEFGTGAVAGSYKITVTKIPPGAPGRPSKMTRLPGIYAETETTTLKADVVTGKNKCDFTLEGTAPPEVHFTPPPTGPPLQSH